ncbi:MULTISPECIES: LexA family transcriptional regulator [unclassified Chelatococcus]|uniref:helix-turn-helix domain-containing protein n=1 Tax=unclassified Chelatococcus TaxID=2638111 RepID=UPI001BCB6EA4|nr:MULTISPECIES: LexA family transcriptional regulator [unclassified Chelatococcus]MBS7696249.1 LexA family transcriptional regulator [Chelatococcus sp. YT9]MBX3560077.1 LexA family transcriptional regulator [Chelatococcus sp.]
MDNEFGEAVRAAREAKGWSQDKLAEAVGTTQSSIDRIERGLVARSRIAPEVAMALGIPLHGRIITTQWPPQTAGGSVGAVDFPIKPRVVAAPSGQIPVYAAMEEDGEILIANDPIDFMKRPEPLEGIEGGYAIYVVGDSMAPEYEPGDLAIVHPRLPPVSGTTCIFYASDLGEGRAMMKRLVRPRQSKWQVKQWSPAKELDLDRAEWPVCHRVVARHVRR